MKMEVGEKTKAGAKGRLYLTRRIWLPQDPLTKVNLWIADAIRKRMPPLPAQGDAALTLFPALRVFQDNHDAIKAELLDVLQIKGRVPELKDVHPRDARISSPQWKTYVMKLWGHDVPVNSARCPRTVAAFSQVPGVHSALFSIMDARGRIPRHRGWATGVVRLHYPLIVPREWSRCRITIEGVEYPWQEREPLLFDDTYDHAVVNETDEARAVLIVDFEPRLALVLNTFMRARYQIVRRTEEIRTICERATVMP
jgi:beta-hydroxylase